MCWASLLSYTMVFLLLGCMLGQQVRTYAGLSCDDGDGGWCGSMLSHHGLNL
jgi:hypothetical protein